MKITVNEAMWDRIVRTILGIVLLYFSFGGVVTGGLSTVLIIIGALAIVTGVSGWCPLYSLMRISTK